MKKGISILLVIFTLIMMLPANTLAETYVSVTVEGETIDFPDARPFIDSNNRTLVPVRFISEALGGQVDWDGAFRQVTITYKDKTIKLVIDKKEIMIDDKEQSMDTQAILKSGRTFVPVRFVSEAMGAQVEWDSANLTVVITLKDETVDLEGLTKEQIIHGLKAYPYIKDKRKPDFLKDDEWYIKADGEEKVLEYVNTAKTYMETFYNVDYKTYDKETYINLLKWFFLESSSWIADDNVLRSNKEHITYWADMIAKKQITIRTEFITDKTCIYTNGSTLIRGRMNYSIESCNDMEWLKKYTRYGNVQLGKKYTCIVDVELANILRRSKEEWKTAELLVFDEHFITEIKEVK